MNNIFDMQKCPFLIGNSNYFLTMANKLDQNNDECAIDIVKEAFYSEENIEYIQNLLKETVYCKSPDKYIISPQKREHLLQIMDGIYHDYAQHLPFDFKEQVLSLDQMLVTTCYPFIISQIDSIYKYVDVHEQPLQFMPPPQATSITGKKSLPSFIK